MDRATRPGRRENRHTNPHFGTPWRRTGGY